MIVAVIPAFNEEKTIAEVVRRVRTQVASVVVVDDGSSDRTGEEATRAKALVVRHIINRGVGAAWNTGFQVALRCGADEVVVLDADGQHQSKDIERLVRPIQRDGIDVTIGVRNFREGMPLARRALNGVANIATYLFFGMRVRDSQSGFRALSRSAVSQMRLHTNHFEVCSEMFGEIKRLGLSYAEVPIESVYTPYSMSKGQGVRSGLRTLRALIINSFTKR